MVAPDTTTFEYLRGRPHAPAGELLEQALRHGRRCRATLTPPMTESSPSTRAQLNPRSPGARHRR